MHINTSAAVFRFTAKHCYSLPLLYQAYLILYKIVFKSNCYTVLILTGLKRRQVLKCSDTFLKCPIHYISITWGHPCTLLVSILSRLAASLELIRFALLYQTLYSIENSAFSTHLFNTQHLLSVCHLKKYFKHLITTKFYSLPY